MTESVLLCRWSTCGRQNTPANIARTVKDLTLIAQQALEVNAQPATAGVITGIEALNEPKTTYLNGPILMSTLFDFYKQAYTAIRGTGFTGDIWVRAPRTALSSAA